MRRIRQIIDALKVISRTPSTTIAASWDAVRDMALSGADRAGTYDVKSLPPGGFRDAITLVDNVLRAVVALAEEDERKAGGELAKVAAAATTMPRPGSAP